MKWTLSLLFAFFIITSTAFSLQSRFQGMNFGDHVERDDEIHWNIRQAIAHTESLVPYVNAINVQVINGVATLTGVVDSSRIKSIATATIRPVTGVREVINLLKVELTPLPTRYPPHYEPRHDLPR